VVAEPLLPDEVAKLKLNVGLVDWDLDGLSRNIFQEYTRYIYIPRTCFPNKIMSLAIQICTCL
jgi:hypothetical protein